MKNLDAKRRIGRRSAITFTSPSKTIQSMKDECDVNQIVKRHGLQNVALNPFADPNARFGDFTDVIDYQDAQNRIAHANEVFASLPSQIRKRFNNDAADFLQFATNNDNADELVKLGFATKRPITQPDASGGKPDATVPGSGDPTNSTP